MQVIYLFINGSTMTNPNKRTIIKLWSGNESIKICLFGKFMNEEPW